MNSLARVLSVAVVALFGAPAQAVIISGIDFPHGNLSFADSVVSFAQGPGPAAAFSDPLNSLGVPDVNTTNGQACFFAPSTANCRFTSLGEAGNLVLRFTDNVLTGSSTTGSVIGVGDGFAELYVFEVGVSESSRVEISANGADWINVGQIGGGSGNSLGVFSYGFDIDKLGYGLTDSFTYVRLTDLQIDGTTSPQGADIDAVGAISSVPAPASLWLLLTGLGGLGHLRARRKRWLRT